MNEIMKERPVLFNAEMVCAILDGRKTQTRRVVKGEPVYMTQFIGRDDEPTGEFGFHEIHDRVIDKHIKCPYGKVGDQLWVRENFKVLVVDEGYKNEDVWDDFQCPMAKVGYSDGESKIFELIVDPDMNIDDLSQAIRAEKKSGASPSIHMPRWASRIQLEITGIRIERLNEITTSDCYAEGIEEWLKDENNHPVCNGKITKFTNAIQAFCLLWQSINGAGSWDKNPWVWVVEFRILKGRKND